MTDAYERAKADDEAWEREHDSRKKLEADAGELVADYARNGSVCDALYHGILALLDRQAAITEREWLEGKTHIFGMAFDEVRSLKAKVDELQAELVATKKSLGLAQARVHELLAERGSEPFCSQVKRWLNGDAPQECRECGDGCYRELCEAFGVKPKRTVESVLSDAVGELFNANISAGSDEWENVIEKYADELRWMVVRDD